MAIMHLFAFVLYVSLIGTVVAAFLNCLFYVYRFFLATYISVLHLYALGLQSPEKGGGSLGLELQMV